MHHHNPTQQTQERSRTSYNGSNQQNPTFRKGIRWTAFHQDTRFHSKEEGHYRQSRPKSIRKPQSIWSKIWAESRTTKPHSDTCNNRSRIGRYSAPIRKHVDRRRWCNGYPSKETQEQHIQKECPGIDRSAACTIAFPRYSRSLTLFDEGCKGHCYVSIWIQMGPRSLEIQTATSVCRRTDSATIALRYQWRIRQYQRFRRIAGWQSQVDRVGRYGWDRRARNSSTPPKEICGIAVAAAMDRTKCTQSPLVVRWFGSRRPAFVSAFSILSISGQNDSLWIGMPNL